MSLERENARRRQYFDGVTGKTSFLLKLSPGRKGRWPRWKDPAKDEPSGGNFKFKGLQAGQLLALWEESRRGGQSGWSSKCGR